MESDARVYVAGHRGLVGSAIVRRLAVDGIDAPLVRTRAELDLRDQAATREFFAHEQPEYVFLAAAHVGGILANSSRPADFLLWNLQIQTNVIEAAFSSGATKLCFMGSSCIYPRLAPQPMKEDHLLTGPLEPTNEAYAVAKIAGIKLCQALHAQHGFSFAALQPSNVYGPGDNFDPQGSHVLAALIRKFHEARRDGRESVEVWGSGKPRRDFVHSDDVADAAVFVMDHAAKDLVANVGWTKDVSIAELASLVSETVGFSGKIVFDASRPDGMPRKLLDTSVMSSAGWRPSIPLKEGLRSVYAWYDASAA